MEVPGTKKMKMSFFAKKRRLSVLIHVKMSTCSVVNLTTDFSIRLQYFDFFMHRSDFSKHLIPKVSPLIPRRHWPSCPISVMAPCHSTSPSISPKPSRPAPTTESITSQTWTCPELSAASSPSPAHPQPTPPPHRPASVQWG